jgi:hypothetical protein
LSGNSKLSLAAEAICYEVGRGWLGDMESTTAAGDSRGRGRRANIFVWKLKNTNPKKASGSSCSRMNATQNRPMAATLGIFLVSGPKGERDGPGLAPRTGSNKVPTTGDSAQPLPSDPHCASCCTSPLTFAGPPCYLSSVAHLQGFKDTVGHVAIAVRNIYKAEVGPAHLDPQGCVLG